MPNEIQRAQPVLEGEILTTDRPKCPFYGMMATKGTLGGFLTTSLSGNACAFGGLCTVEQSNRRPQWDACTTRNNSREKSKTDEIVRTYKAVPDEMRPTNRAPTDWEGVTAADWFRFVMKRPYE